MTGMRAPRLALVLSLLAPAALLSACSDGGTDAVPAAQAPAGQGVTCEYPVSGDPAEPVDPPNGENVAKTGTASVTMVLDGKPVTITMDRSKAPCTVNNFESLAKQGWYTDTTCHRLVDQGIFILQCGDPSGTGRGGPGYSFADELDGAKALPAGPRAGSVTYPKGTVAMANAGPDTNGSQIFLVWEDSPLDPAYTVLGQMDAKSVAAVGEVAAQGVAADGVAPNAPAKITEVTLG